MTKKKQSTFSMVQGATNPTVLSVGSTYIRRRTSIIESRELANKRNLPAVCWAADFEDGKRHKESAKWNGLAYIDIDHVHDNWPDYKPELDYYMNTKAFYEQRFGGREQELRIVHAQISPSFDGLHIVFVPEIAPDAERGLELAQQKFADNAGLSFWDKSCHDLSRLLFLTPIACTLYDVTDILTND